MKKFINYLYLIFIILNYINQINCINSNNNQNQNQNQNNIIINNKDNSNSNNNNNNHRIDANKILRENFEHKLYILDQQDNINIVKELVEKDPLFYSDLVDKFNNKLQDTKTTTTTTSSIEQFQDAYISSGSGQNYWDGESCQATTFNWSRTTNCPNDCYDVWGQGSCNTTTGQCKCNFFYTGIDCSENYNPNHDWDGMPCNGGRYCPPIYATNEPRHCFCPPGQEGLECNVCSSSIGCNNLLSNDTESYLCDSSHYTYSDKHYSCFVTSPEVNGDLNNSTASASIECKFPGYSYSNQTGQCSMNLYYHITGTPLYFNCSFYECDRTILPGQNQSIICQHSVCNCTSYCGFFLAGIIAQVNGPAQFICGQGLNSSSVDCQFSQNEISLLLPVIPLSCSAGECLLENDPPPPIYPVPVSKIMFLYFYIGSGVGTVVISLIAGCIFLILSHQKERKNFIEDTHLVCELSFQNISCYVNERKTIMGKEVRKTILDNVNGVCPPGQLTALMGLSGSGKTSLLDILSGRKNVGLLEGSVLINGAPVGKNFKRISGYVTQDDIMIGTLTCREHLMYAAELKLPEHMSNEYKAQRVTDVLEELGLTRVADNTIGTPEKRGISGGERRRLSIATELIVNPSILFLDEPTSGLDSHSAAELITKLKQLANNSITGQRTIIFSIHQPSAEIFEQFDNLILLHQGTPFYSGKAEHSVEYFVEKKRETMNESEREQYRMHLRNPADFIISMVTDKNAQRIYSPNVSPSINHRSPIINSNNNNNNQRHHHQQLSNKSRHIKNNSGSDNNYGASGSNDIGYSGELGNSNNSNNNPSAAEDNHLLYHHQQQQQQPNNEPLASLIKIGKVEEYATSFWTQFFVVCRRSLLNYIRNPFLLRTTYFVHTFVGLTLGYLFWKLPANLEPGCQDRFGVFFFITALLSFGSITSLDLFYNDRIIFIRERANGFYRTSAYFLAKVVTDIIPMRVIPPIILGSICYYMIGLQPGILHFIYFLISLVLTSTVASSMCMAISTISPTFGTANMVSILLLFIFLLFDGFLLARFSIPKYLIWLVWVSFMSYSLEIPVVNEFKGLWVQYNPPNTKPTYADGLEFLSTIGASPERLFIDMYVLIGMIFGYLFLAYIFLRFLVREYR